MALRLGKSSKDSQYLKRIKDAIEGKSDHPRNLGVRMQAHHVISAEGMKRSKLDKQIEKFGYDINLLPNLVFIPCTLQGACHLGIQPHRGNHTAPVDQDNYDDDSEPNDYHDMVARRIQELDLPLRKECPGDKIEKAFEVRTKLDKLSTDILGLIQKKPGKAPLTTIAKFFNPGNPIGCAGVDSIEHFRPTNACPCERGHQMRQGDRQKAENIKYSKDKKYQMRCGR